MFFKRYEVPQFTAQAAAGKIKASSLNESWGAFTPHTKAFYSAAID